MNAWLYFLEEHIKVLFLMSLHDRLLCLCVSKVKTSSWVTLFFHFICKAQSAEWTLVHNGGLMME